MENVKLFATWSCPFVKRVVWALNLKNIEHEIIYEDLANKSPELLKYNPIHKRVPVLVHNGIPICESLVILEYIDETWKDTHPLLPKEPLDKARERFWARFANEEVLPSYFGYVLKKGKDQEEAKETMLAHLKHIENLLSEMKFLSGERIGYLDLVYGWLAENCHTLEVVLDVKVLDEDSFPNLWAWKDRFLNNPAIKKSWPDQETLRAKYQERKESSGK
ncbi:glutathione transferase GST 23-like [Bidens hawaiensis]|uniref:glutathione transferase GST 23-like n=1 Tax=Bidens hawaiensis TaxID=980011 RepID=UPI00404ACC10